MTLTIQLDDRTTRRLQDVSRRSHTKPEEVAADAIRRRLFVDWFDEINERISQRAKDRGFTSEEDFLNAVISL